MIYDIGSKAYRPIDENKHFIKQEMDDFISLGLHQDANNIFTRGNSLDFNIEDLKQKIKPEVDWDTWSHNPKPITFPTMLRKFQCEVKKENVREREVKNEFVKIQTVIDFEDTNQTRKDLTVRSFGNEEIKEEGKFTSFDVSMSGIEVRQHKPKIKHKSSSPGPKLICDICNTSFSLRGNLLRHISRHMKGNSVNPRHRKREQQLIGKYTVNPMPFKCFFCGRRFQQQTNLSKHISKRHSDNRYPDSLGSTIKAEQMSSLTIKNNKEPNITKIHVKTLHGERVHYNCHCCGREYKHLRDLTSHINNNLNTNNMSEENTYLNVYDEYRRVDCLKRGLFCKLCRKSFVLEESLEAHVRLIHSIENKHKCQQCGKMFSHVIELELHLRVHSGNKSTICHICRRQLSSLQTLRSHLRTHTGAKPYRCKICGECFAQSATLVSHKKTHVSEIPSFKCGECGKLFYRRGGLNVHFKNHLGKNGLGEKNFTCAFCAENQVTCRQDTGDWSRSKPTSLEQDLASWLSVRCAGNDNRVSTTLLVARVNSATSKSFTRLCILKDHIMSHGNERPYHCDLCDKSFQKKGTLTQHKYLHTGLRSYVCTKCGKAFAQSSTLRCHMKIHK
uniref:(California timema) hypothetical protein n=1 Tax=Timema californicum TaxID=61474 RepID=A0A7R9J2S8_TIMCA|nr:unnamed protein product [Timema californicum]